MIAVDTNVLVYAFDATDESKHAVAKKLLEDILNGKQKALVTNQVLAEFVYVSTRKMRVPLTKVEAELVVTTLLRNQHVSVRDYSGRTVLAATAAEQPFWDALLAQTLIENGVREIYTENTKDFVGSGVRAHNPFSKGANKGKKS